MMQVEEASKVSGPLWRTLAGFVLLIATALRIYDLNLVVLHHDEGVNGNFLKLLVRHGIYQYDPQNYHGPSLYYLSAIIPWLSRLLLGEATGDVYGLNTFTIRFVTVAFGVGTIWLTLCLRRYIGAVAALGAATLLAISPGAIYLSRYFIHEPLMVFFTLGMVIATIRFYQDASTAYLLLASGLTALLFATKETAIISAVVLVVAAVATLLFVWIRQRYQHDHAHESQTLDVKQAVSDFIQRLGGPGAVAILLIAGLSLFVAVNILLYSSFFRNYPQGLYDALKTFQFWTRTGTQVHVHPWYTYLVWMWQKESVLLVLGATGIALAVWRGTNAFVVFASLWAFGLFLAYSLIPYKTPWLMLNFLVPLSITAGYAVAEIYRSFKNRKSYVLAAVVTVGAAGVSVYQAITLNFFHYDDPSYVYVYAHTYREFLPLVDQIVRAGDLSGTGKQTEITITSPEYWPLPWYLRNYPKAKFYGHMTAVTDPIVVGIDTQEVELRSVLGDRYSMIKSSATPTGAFPLRPQVNLVLFVRSDLAQKLQP